MNPDFSRTLNRQVKKYLGTTPSLPGLEGFLQAVNDTYKTFDRDRELLERSLDLTSAELTASNERFRAERTQALERLSESEQILQSINENLSEGVFRIDSAGNFHFVNQAFRKLVGATESLPPNFGLVFSDPETWFTLKSMIEINGFVKKEESQINGTSGLIWVLISIVKVNVPGKGDVYDGSVINITQQKETERNLRRANDILANTINIRKKAEEDLRRALEKERELTELKSRLVSMTSHEFRTPLTTIQANAELLNMRLSGLSAEELGKVRRHIDRITVEITKLTKLLDDILLMGRYESGKITFHPEEHDLVGLLRDVLQTKGTMSSDPRILTLRIEGTPRSVVIDPTLLTHALSNLVSNALKYSVGNREPEVTMSFEPAQVQIRIKDFGIGIPEADRANLFQTFFRASNATQIQGTGMGLVIVKLFVELHGGQVHLDSTEGEGTTVTVTIPTASQPKTTV